MTGTGSLQDQLSKIVPHVIVSKEEVNDFVQRHSEATGVDITEGIFVEVPRKVFKKKPSYPPAATDIKSDNDLLTNVTFYK